MIWYMKSWNIKASFWWFDIWNHEDFMIWYENLMIWYIEFDDENLIGRISTYTIMMPNVTRKIEYYGSGGQLVIGKTPFWRFGICTITILRVREGWSLTSKTFFQKVADVSRNDFKCGSTRPNLTRGLSEGGSYTTGLDALTGNKHSWHCIAYMARHST